MKYGIAMVAEGLPKPGPSIGHFDRIDTREFLVLATIAHLEARDEDFEHDEVLEEINDLLDGCASVGDGFELELGNGAGFYVERVDG